MKTIGAYLGIFFGGLILIWFTFINLPNLVKELSSFSNNSHGLAASAGTIIGNIFIIIAGIALLRNGIKKLNGNESKRISDKIVFEKVKSPGFVDQDSVNSNEKEKPAKTENNYLGTVLLYSILFLLGGVVSYFIFNQPSKIPSSANNNVSDLVNINSNKDTTPEYNHIRAIEELDERIILKQLYGNWNSMTTNEKINYFAKYVPDVRRDGENRPCSDMNDSLKYFIYSIQTIFDKNEEYFVVFCKTEETGAGYCNNSWFDVAIYHKTTSQINTEKSIYELISFKPFLFSTWKGDVNVEIIKLGKDENGFQFIGTQHQMGERIHGAIYSFSTFGLSKKIQYNLYEASGRCYLPDSSDKKPKYSVTSLADVANSEYYDILISSFEVENEGDSICQIICNRTMYSYSNNNDVENENGYRVKTKASEKVNSFVVD